MMHHEQLARLNTLQRDALKEIGNIGAGNAATALALLLNCKIMMTVPRVEIIPLEKIPEITGSTEEIVTGVLIKVRGEAPGHFLFLLPDRARDTFLDSVLADRFKDRNAEKELSISALQEVTNILAGAYLKALNKQTGLSLLQSLPVYAHDMAGAVLSSSMIHYLQKSNYALLIENNFMNSVNQLQSYLFFIPEPGALQVILATQGLKSDE